ncbi:MAG: glycoside hydrolase family 43 protein, partial [Clostridia bacterium]
MKKIISSITAALMVAAPVSAREVSVHDPSIIKADGIYYLFGTHITSVKSEDLINWTEFTNGYTTPGNALFGDLAENLKGSFLWAGDHDTDCPNGYAVWAPDVYYNPDYINPEGSKGAYLMYYSASSTYKRSCIGIAASQTPEGPYTYVDTIVYSGFTKVDAYDNNSRVNKNYTNTNLGKLIADGTISGYNDSWGVNDYNSSYAPNCIDPCIYEDTDGGLWMVYGSWSGGIYVLQLNKETGRPIYPGTDGTTAGGNPVDRYFGTKIAGGNGLSGEGPFIYYDKEAGYYFLQDTYEWLGEDGGYHIRMFRSKNPDGPFVDSMGRNALYTNQGLAYQGVKMFGNYRFDEMDYAYKSGGHCSTLIDDDGQRYLFYHTRFSHLGGYFEMRVHQMFLNEDNWPVVAPYRYLGSEISESGYDPTEVTGYYQYINHGSATGQGGTYQTPEGICLEADGTVRGSVNGSWQMNGKYVTLNLGGTAYKGVFFKQKNESGREVMTFSAVGNNNCCVWGSKTYNKSDTASMAAYSLNGSLGDAITVAYPSSSSNPVEIDKEVTYEDAVKGKALKMDGTYGLKLPDTGPLK